MASDDPKVAALVSAVEGAIRAALAPVVKRVQVLETATAGLAARARAAADPVDQVMAFVDEHLAASLTRLADSLRADGIDEPGVEKEIAVVTNRYATERDERRAVIRAAFEEHNGER